MNVQASDSRASTDWRRIHALGLPSGSVRALLAILIFSTIWGLLVLQPFQEVPDYLRGLLFIIMGHYFASRRWTEPATVPGPPPLYLPRGSVRLFLVAGCIAVAALLHSRGQLTTLEAHPGSVTLLLVGGFLLGVCMNAVAVWWRDRGYQSPRIIEDVRALTSMTAAVLLLLLVWNRVIPLLPSSSVESLLPQGLHLGPAGPEHILAALVGFYFGSRS
jgi:hypothetical protein